MKVCRQTMNVRILVILTISISFACYLLAPAQCIANDDGTHLIQVFPVTTPQISSGYGNRFHPIRKYTSKHTGVDLAAPSHSHIRTVADGTVVFAGKHEGGYGKLVTVRHAGGFVSLYAHMDEILVNVGDRLKAGQLVGRLGSTGASTGPHLHFEWRKDGKPLNPMHVLPGLAEKAEG